VSRAASVPDVKGYAQTGSDSICLMVGNPSFTGLGKSCPSSDQKHIR
jgi:hypothetical protein